MATNKIQKRKEASKEAEVTDLKAHEKSLQRATDELMKGLVEFGIGEAWVTKHRDTIKSMIGKRKQAIEVTDKRLKKK